MVIIFHNIIVLWSNKSHAEQDFFQKYLKTLLTQTVVYKEPYSLGFYKLASK